MPSMNALLLLWIALIGGDRINLLGAHSPFLLTPFLALTPVVLVSELVRRARAGSRITYSNGALGFVVLCLLLLSLCLASVYVSRDFSAAAPRVVLLAIQLSGTFGVLVLARDRRNLSAILARGARWALLTFIAFNIAEVLAWLEVIPAQLPAGTGIISLAPDVYAGFVPRLSGMVLDSNRGGLMLVIMGFLVVHGDANRTRAWRWICAASVLLLLTLSRSAALAGLACVATVALTGNMLAIPRRLVATVSFAVAIVAGTLLIRPAAREVAATTLAPLASRLSILEGSSRDHLRLITRGLHTSAESMNAAVRGLGYGSSHMALQDFFPGNRYGNFHSIYIGMLVEAGVFALLVLLSLILIPLLRRGEYRPVVAAAATFGLFYGALSEPVFWLALVLAWISLPVSNSRPNASVNDTANARIAPSNS